MSIKKRITYSDADIESIKREFTIKCELTIDECFLLREKCECKKEFYLVFGKIDMDAIAHVLGDLKATFVGEDYYGLFNQLNKALTYYHFSSRNIKPFHLTRIQTGYLILNIYHLLKSIKKIRELVTPLFGRVQLPIEDYSEESQKKLLVVVANFYENIKGLTCLIPLL